MAVLAHELGHWYLNHVFKNFAFGQVCLTFELRCNYDYDFASCECLAPRGQVLISSKPEYSSYTQTALRYHNILTKHW